jgi:AraC family transcriptional regulator of adaptative response / DNA-3-methyladenine glycosylase II
MARNQVVRKKANAVNEEVGAPINVDRFEALPAAAVCESARQSRDPRFDGRFFVAVVSTGIFCRPTCPARIPAEHNVRYFANAAAASDAGYRPCRRCHPEASLPMPEWALGNPHIVRALRLIDGGFLNQQPVGALAQRLGMSERHLDRVFMQVLGATPLSIARLKRAQLARQLLATTLPLVQVAEHAGYGSVSQFNREMKRFFHLAPSQLRKSRGQAETPLTLTLLLPVRQPYNFDWVFDYLRVRALAGVETVHGHCYTRRLAAGGGCVVVQREGQNLRVQLPLGEESTHSLLRRVVRLFDLDADGDTIHTQLGQQSGLKQWVKQAPGLRVPGAWDGFETAVRAVLGQQVSVARGTVLANALIDRYGKGDFPTPEQLCDREIAEVGMPGQRGRAISTIARGVMNGELDFSDHCNSEKLEANLASITGIGPWTINYIKLRVTKDPDAFPHNDWVVLKQLATTPAKASKQAESWRPWRAYALMYIWFAAMQSRERGKTQ